MRKSLGEKRKEISGQQIEEITRLYGDFAEGQKVKIFTNREFGFLRITVERPLRLRWEVTDEAIAAALAGKAVQKLPDDAQSVVRDVLEQHRGAQFATQREVIKQLGPALGGLGLAAPAQKAVWSALAVRDQDAPIITDRKGNPEPDPDLRDNENVPLPPTAVFFVEDPTERFGTLEYRTAIDDYVGHEVLPYVPDAWGDRR
jgi:type I restriction enzyme M protein